ncbi:MAG: hypothetical protein F4065_06145 [Rhodothermaceae bacterium]|nr:hypothetical protein [Rhodothermaceae bacterium]MYB91351.1 hypothetical protein [Rhodothermaceae bacterium]MYG45446.1 hypothetical protein [Rhodothermaceae bacterium]MYH12811.1 hypothetical protein [Rhodothermaceae bacterium]MYJ49975.1 hypothetical protein [Rhodothermaceae bacterium]
MKELYMCIDGSFERIPKAQYGTNEDAAAFLLWNLRGKDNGCIKCEIKPVGRSSSNPEEMSKHHKYLFKVFVPPYRTHAVLPDITMEIKHFSVIPGDDDAVAVLDGKVNDLRKVKIEREETERAKREANSSKEERQRLEKYSQAAGGKKVSRTKDGGLKIG